MLPFGGMIYSRMLLFGGIVSKIGVLKKLCELADTVIVGGALGTTFNFACGKNVGNWSGIVKVYVR